MAKQFGGFTEPQKEILARKMGFKGPMDQFGAYLQSSPSYQNKFLSYENKAKQMLAGDLTDTKKPAPAFAAGGAVTAPAPTDNTANITSFYKNTLGKDVDPAGLEYWNKSGLSGKDLENAIARGGLTGDALATYEKNAQRQVMIDKSGTGLNQQAIINPDSFVTPVKATPITTSAEEFINPASGQTGPAPQAGFVSAGSAATATTPTATPTHTVSTVNSAAGVKAETDSLQAEQGTVSADAQVEAAQALPSVDATVQGQLAKLMQQFDGGQTPIWASGAIRNANAAMAARGLGASSMAGGAVTQAAMESAIQIAAQDASTFSAFEMQNLNNRQQARLVNAQAFLQMDLANLDNRQQTALFKSQSIIQSLFTDQAAENATRQFNASSQNQSDQFFANLKTQVNQFNVAQKNAMSQFNAGQQNSMGQFNAQMKQASDQFNAQNRLIVDQSNAEWRRAVTTTNNATTNEANRINAQSATGMTLAGYNNMMQTERDLYSFAYQSAENAKDRAAELTLAKFQASSNKKNATGEALGNLAGAVIGGIKW